MSLWANPDPVKLSVISKDDATGGCVGRYVGFRVGQRVGFFVGDQIGEEVGLFVGFDIVFGTDGAIGTNVGMFGDSDGYFVVGSLRGSLFVTIVIVKTVFLPLCPNVQM
jgi:hypothetical protein